MVNLIFIFFFFLLLFPIFALTPLQIRIVAEHSQRNDETVLQFGFLWGLIKIKINIKSVELGLDKIVNLLHIGAKLGGQDHATQVQHHISVKLLYELIQRIDLALIKKLWLHRRKFIPPANCTKLVWITKIGLDDAAVTGIFTGLLWSVKGIVYSVICQMEHRHMGKVELNVIPNFKQKLFEVHLDCIFKFTIGHIIIAGIKLIFFLLFFWLKGGETIGRPSNRSFNENSYGKY
ncbi:MAG: DUF2953 domain-containing protein [Clostridia bacterium]|nr:DUF2953 domain-containing protein [Clostridia bacterium]